MRDPAKEFECEGMLFDLDGVLVDSTPAVERIWRDWAAQRGLDAGDILAVAHGRRTAETIRLVAPNLDADAEALRLEQTEVQDLDGVLRFDAAHGLLSSLPEGSWGVVTSGTRALATRRLEHTDLPVPRTLVTAEDVTDGKPHPEAYLMGARLLGVSPADCVVIEDAPSGIRAAKAAGMSFVAVATTHPEEQLSEADAVVDSLDRIRPASSPEGSKPRLRLRLGRPEQA